MNSYTSNHETMDEKDDQQHNTMEPYYDQPEKIIVSLAHTIIIVHAYYDSNCKNYIEAVTEY